MSPTPCRVLVLGAHPDDAEVFAGGLVVRHCRQGSTVRIISVTDGRCGHHEIPANELVEIRRREAQAAGRRVGAEYISWDFPDGALQPNLEVRESLIREIRKFRPDLILTHRPCDYHPDHRAVGTAVQDASYLVTVPHVCPDVPALQRDPVVASMCDLFTRPNRMRADVLLNVSAEFDLVAQMAACHRSQFFEWLPYHDGILASVPSDDAQRLDWLCDWFAQLHAARREFFKVDLVERGWRLEEETKLEVYELSEYAASPTPDDLIRLFPDASP